MLMDELKIVFKTTDATGTIDSECLAVYIEIEFRSTQTLPEPCTNG